MERQSSCSLIFISGSIPTILLVHPEFVLVRNATKRVREDALLLERQFLGDLGSLGELVGRAGLALEGLGSELGLSYWDVRDRDVR